MDLSVKIAIWRNTMAKGVFYLIDVEHEGDVQYAKSQIIENGGTIDKVVWTGIEDDDACIVVSAATKQQVQTSKSILQHG